MGGIIEDVGEAVGGFFGEITGSSAQREALEQSAQAQREALQLQREIYEEMRARLPQAEATLQQQYQRAREQMQQALGRSLAQVGLTQAQHGRLLSRAGAMGYLSSGGLENVYRASAEEIASSALRAFGSYGAGLAQLEADLGGRLAALPAEYLRGAASSLSIAPQYMSATAALAAAQPPSLFDRMIQVGTLALLGMAVL